MASGQTDQFESRARVYNRGIVPVAEGPGTPVHALDAAVNLPYVLDGHWIWASVVVVFLIAEIFTGGTYMLPLAVAAAAAAIISYFTSLGPVVEVLVFCGVTVIAYFAMRPFAARVTNAPDVSFGADRLVGMSGIVTKAIDGVNISGMVKIRGEEWRARSADGTPIPEGSEVIVQSVDGAHLRVSPPPA